MPNKIYFVDNLTASVMLHNQNLYFKNYLLTPDSTQEMYLTECIGGTITRQTVYVTFEITGLWFKAFW